MLSLAVPGAKPFAPFPLGFVMARPLRDSLVRAPQGRQAACAEGPPAAALTS